MEFNFPDDIFQNILSFFHSPYREPNHYKAILGQDDFYFLTQRNKNAGLSYYYNFRFYDSANISYYFKIIINSGKNTTVKNIMRFKRGVAAKNILPDFVKIFTEYENKKYLNGYVNNSTKLTYI
tara:strand:+ start:10723 stop:11094 length:372 start_codon:yes stop_codon:yes gene_type:complete